MKRGQATNLIISLLIVIFLLLVYKIFQNVPQSPSLVKPTSNIRLTGAEVAINTAKFLESTRQNDGIFHLLYSCQDNTCSMETEQRFRFHSNGQIISFYKELYLLTSNPKYKQLADDTMNLFIDRCQRDGGESCSENFDPIEIYYNETPDKKYINALKKAEAKYFENLTPEEVLANQAVWKLKVLYDMTGDKKYLNRLTTYAEEISAKYPLPGSNDPLQPNLFFIAETVYIPAYKATNNPTYLSLAEKTIEITNIGKHLKEMSQTKTVLSNLLTTLIELSEVSPKAPIYKNHINNIAQEIIYDHWDTPDNKKFNGDFGFLSATKDKDNTKSGLVTAQIGRAFIKLNNQKFNLVR